MKYLRLVRAGNLLIIAMTMMAMYYFILIPFIGVPALTTLNFYLLLGATFSISAAGYIINDYFDRKIDLMNRPDNVVVGTRIHRRFAIILHWVFNIIGIVLGVYLSYRIGHVWYGLIFIISASILWYYSISFKRKLLIGNLVVAVMTALVPYLVFFYEVLSFPGEAIEVSQNIAYLRIIFMGFSIFALLLNFIREIVKDIEDYRGDYRAGCSTLPITIGIKNSKYIVSALALIMGVAIILIWFSYLNQVFYITYSLASMLYLLLFIALPCLYIAVQILYANRKQNIRRISLLIKIIMLFGILFSAVIYANLKP